MKHILTLIIICFFAFEVKSQELFPIDTFSNKLNYSGVVKLDSTFSKDRLYTITRQWVAQSYKSAQNVIQMDDKESGKIVVKAIFPVYVKVLGMLAWQGDFNYTMIIQVKDGRYKYEVTDFYHTGGYKEGIQFESLGTYEQMKLYDGAFVGRYEKILNNIPSNIHPLIISLRTYVISNADTFKKDDW